MKFKAAILILSGLVGASLSAQIAQEPVDLSVSFRTEYDALGSGSYVSSYFGGVGSSSSGSSSAYGWVMASDASAQLKPGKDYFFTIFGINLDGARTHFSAPPGYTLYIENSERLRYNGQDSSGVYIPLDYDTLVIKVRLDKPATSKVHRQAGVATSFMDGNSIWEVGLGSLKSGKSAGSLAIRSVSLSSGSYTRSSLIYDSESAEIDVVRDGSGIRQIFANQAFVDVITTETNVAFELRFYSLSQVGSKQGGLYPVSGSPFLTYEVRNPQTSTTNYIRITKTIGSAHWETELYNPGVTVWQLTDWHKTSETPIRKDMRSRNSSGLDETVEIQNSAGAVATRTRNQYATKAWGKELVTKTEAYGTDDLVTSYTYHESASYPGNYRKVKSVKHPDGSWIKTDYYDDTISLGEVKTIYRPWEDYPTDPSSSETNRMDVTSYEYEADWTGRKAVVKKIERKQPHWTGSAWESEAVERTLFDYGSDTVTASGQQEPILIVTRDDYTSNTGKLTTIVKRFREDADDGIHYYPDLPYSVTHPDNTKESYVYLRGVVHPSLFLGYPFIPDAGGSSRLQRIYYGMDSSHPSGDPLDFISETGQDFDIDNIKLIPNKSTRRDIIRSERGTVLYDATYLYNGTGFVLIEGNKTVRDALGNLTKTYKITAYDSAHASITAYEATYSDGEISTEEFEDGTKLKSIVVDGLGRRVEETKEGAADYESGEVKLGAQSDVRTLYEYDPDGRLTKQTIKRTTGTASDIVETYAYDKAGRLVSHTRPGDTDTPSLTTTIDHEYSSDPQKKRIAYPGGGDRIEEQYIDGRPKRVTGSAQPSEFFFHIVESNGNRLTQSKRLETSSDGWYNRRVDWLGRPQQEFGPSFLWPVDSQAINVLTYYYNDSGQMSKIVHTSNAVGKISPDVRFEYDEMGRLAQEGEDVDGDGVITDNADSPDRITDYATDFHWDGSIFWLRQRTFAYPDQTTTNSTRKLVQEVKTRITELDTTTRWEQLVTDASGNTTRRTVKINQSAKQRTVELEDPFSSTVGWEIHHNGLLAQTKSTSGVLTRYTYDELARLESVFGRDSVEENYDYYSGSTLVHKISNAHYPTKTFNYGSDGRVWEVKNSLSEATRYNYNEKGQVTHVWGDAATPVKYEYHDYGWRTKMHTYREGSNWSGTSWPSGYEGSAIGTTEWIHHPKTGLLKQKKDDAGASTYYSYNVKHQLKQIDLPNGKTKYFEYYGINGGIEQNGTGDLRRVHYSDGTHEVVYDYLRDGRIDTVDDEADTREFSYRSDLQLDKETFGAFYGGRVLKRNYEASGRSSGFEMGYSYDTDYHYKESYGYQSGTGRLSSVQRSVGTTQTFSYGYKAGSDLMASVQNGSYLRQKFYQSYRDIAEQIDNSWGSSVRARYTYGTDWEGRFMTEKLRGHPVGHSAALPAKHGFAYGVQADYTYNARSEVEDSDTVTLNSSAQPTSTFVAGRHRDWTYDNAQNLTKLERSGVGTTNYASSDLNAYTAATGHLAETFTYDAAGNMASDGTYDYTYDAENRLIEVKAKSPSTGSMRQTFKYDYLGRRIYKKHETYSGGWNTQYTRHFFYNGWNLALETDSANNPIRSYTWGLDSSSTMGGSGGVEGLLMIREGSSNYYPTYDGRGNLTGLLDSSGQYVATYEYDAYGNVVQSWGTYSGNPFGFSTKYTDETGLVYFGHRYYSPKLGRFVNRDPIGEAGGANLYAYTRNDPVNHSDYLGLATLESGSLVKRNITVRYEVTYPVLTPFWYPGADAVEWFVNLVTEKRERNYVFWQRQATGTQTVSDPGANQSPSLDMEPAPGSDVLREAREKHGSWQDVVADQSLTDFEKEILLIAEHDFSPGAARDLLHGGLQDLTLDIALLISGEKVLGGVVEYAGKAVSGLLSRIIARQADEVAILDDLVPVCFTAGTLVLTASGYEEIQNIDDGDQVWSYNVNSEAWELMEVIETFSHLYEGDMVTISLADIEVEATGNHPFWLVEGSGLSCRPFARDVSAGERGRTKNGRWVEARDLAVGDVLLLRSGERIVVSSVASSPSTTWVFNIEVANNSTYSVSENGILVHNKAAPRRKPGKFGEFKGTDALRRENKMARDAAKRAGLNIEQREILHREISGQGWGYQKILEVAKAIKSGG